ncbi:hypothetical protein QBC34DRAFT_435395 [Podospora aff. communis PSN243]|uniref:F-box domain-containing protein n=1 Tax=Podospora aff. communis PSN243 TaxID=3040156 RepID=A0AAV9GW18_9PEZI|nr:hypothetical protein QBC34DRAFT_435395 [Podospora aff. communis PSN243]
MECMRKLRDQINEISRPFVRATIMDLPDETLQQIFSLVSKDVRGRTMVHDIQQCRLVSTQLWKVHWPGFEEISQHPHISRSVKVVCFSLHHFKPMESFQCFGQWVLNELESAAGPEKDPNAALNNWLPHLSETWENWGVDAGTAQNICDNIKVFCDNMRRLLCGESDGSGDMDAAMWEFMGTQHDEYRRLYLWQQDYLKTTFSQRVAAAMSRMPFARNGVKFVDSIPDQTRSPVPGFPYKEVWPNPCDGQKSLDILARHKVLLRPLPLLWAPWSQRRRADLNKLLGSTANAMARVQIFPRSIEIKARQTYMGWLLPIRPEQCQEMLGWMKELETFIFRAESSLDLVSYQREVEAAMFFAPFLDAPNLQKLHIIIDASKHRGSDDDRGAVQKLWLALAAKPRPCLNDIALKGLAMHSKHLFALLGQPRPMKRLYLDSISLLTGTWAEVLDVLQKFESQVKVVKSPRGGEGRYPRTTKEFDQIFYDKPDELGGETLAGFYIQGGGAPNPLLALGLPERFYELLQQVDEEDLQRFSNEAATYKSQRVKGFFFDSEEELEGMRMGRPIRKWTGRSDLCHSDGD